MLAQRQNEPDNQETGLSAAAASASLAGLLSALDTAAF